MKPAIVLLILGLIAAPLASAQDTASLERMRQDAAAGNDAAQLEMGILYEFGYRMPKNEINALAWYLLAAERGNTLAIKRRDVLKSTMPSADIEAAEKMSRELLSAGVTPAAKTETTAMPEAAPTAEAAPAEPSAPLIGPPGAPAPTP